MTYRLRPLQRRSLLFAAIGAGLTGLPAYGQQDLQELMPPPTNESNGASLTPSDISVYNNAALQVRSLNEVFFIAITRTGKRLVAVGEHGVIIYSDDEGASWTQGQVPVDVSLTCVGFATPLLGWAAGHYGVILNTADGGKTWQLQLQGLQVNKLAVAAAQQAAANPPAPGASNVSPALELGTGRANRFLSLGPDKPFLSLIVLGPQKILVIGAYRIAVMSNDGGKTWVDWSLHIYDRLSHDLYDISQVGNDLYIACETGLVFRSTDGGESFPQVTAVGETVFGVIGASDGSVLVYGIAGGCFRSTDNGTTWTTVNINSEDDLIAARLLASGEVVIARASGGLFVSHDNGASFTPVANWPRVPIADFLPISNSSVVVACAAGATLVPVVL